MKKFFTGEEEPPRRRVTTCQKCIRTPDLDRVGITARHGTFFEMLGNFSFGDYFKEEAISWSWEFLTKTLEIPGDLLWPSVYENDDESYAIWRDKIGVPEAHIVRMGKADNFWEHGSGPCGPCSEIYFDRGEKYGCGSPDCKPGCDCDRYMEIWNNVFSQFNNDGHGNYTELIQKNIDTGMGLERLACVMQGVDNMFEVDTNRAILDTVTSISGKTYGEDVKNDISIRVCTDHIKSAMFMIADGVIPSNEGRGYVLRRIIRRACRHGKLLGIDHQFLVDLCRVAMAQNEGAYPELAEKHDYILKVLDLEEKRFDATIDAGLSILSNIAQECVRAGRNIISGEDAFKLYDTFGFPIDLTREIAAEQKLDIDEDTFKALMQSQRERARSARANISGWSNASKSLIAGLPQTEFVGYEKLRAKAKILALIVDDMSVEEVSEGDVTVVLDTTSFYGEGGGQVGDRGTIAKEGSSLHVYDTQKTDGVYLHLCTVANGSFAVGDEIDAVVGGGFRRNVMGNHSSCHLLQAALRQVLGKHVEQAGSYVNDQYMRFDFTHFAALTAEELAKVEMIVNQSIMAALPVEKLELPIEQAKKMGAMALFGEKYGDIVRVVKMGEISTEFCGGTHVDNTAQIGLYKIISETSVAAGVRRIEAVTGYGVLNLIAEKDRLIHETATAIKAQNVNELGRRAAAVMSEIKDQKREIEALNAKLASTKLDAIRSGAVEIKGTKLFTGRLDGMNVAAARALTDDIKAAEPNAVIVLAVVADGKLNFIGAAGPEAVKLGAHAGKLIGAVAAVASGKGGGRPDSAMAGATAIDKIADALNTAKATLDGMIK